MPGLDPYLPRTGWTATADSEMRSRGGLHPAIHAIDGNNATIWHSSWEPQPPARLPHRLNIFWPSDVEYQVSGIMMLPRQDGSTGRIGRYRVLLSTDGETFSRKAVATGKWSDDGTAKFATWKPALAKGLRLVALTEAGSRGSSTAVSELYVLGLPALNASTQ